MPDSKAIKQVHDIFCGDVACSISVESSKQWSRVHLLMGRKDCSTHLWPPWHMGSLQGLPQLSPPC